MTRDSSVGLMDMVNIVVDQCKFPNYHSLKVGNNGKRDWRGLHHIILGNLRYSSGDNCTPISVFDDGRLHNVVNCSL